MTSVTPFLWFEEDIRAVVGFYRGVFKDAKLLSPPAEEAPQGDVPE